MMQNIRLIIAYEGTAYNGWQKTPTGPSVEAALQSAIERIVQHPVQLQAASRTDAGVHAEGQVVNFFTDTPNLDIKKLQYGINALVPKDIAVLDLEIVDPSFHPTLDCIGKEYHYWLCLGPAQLPIYRHTSWHYPFSLDFEAMRDAAKHIKGTHDFAAFFNVRKNDAYESTIREVHDIRIVQADSRLRIEVTGNHFLYKMVRNIVGTLVTVGADKLPPQEVKAILHSKDRTQAPLTAPAHGLFLHRVMY